MDELNSTLTDLLKKYFWGGVMMLYVFLLFYIGRTPEYSSYVTKGVTPILFIAVFFISKNPIGKLSREYFLYIALFMWAIFSGLKADNFEHYRRFIQLFVGISMLLTISFILFRKYNIFYLFHLGIFISVLFVVYDSYINFNLQEIVTNEIVGQRLGGITGNANTIGGIFLIGSMSCLFLFNHYSGILRRIVILIGQGAILSGIIATASRSTILSFICLWGLYLFGILILKKKYLLLGITTYLIVIGSLAGFNYIINETYLGTRVTKLQKGKDGSGNSRYKLFEEGMDMFIHNPIMGVGLGNFSNNTSEGFYAHNDYLEIIGTLGIVGVLIYSLFLFTFYNRLRQLKKFLLTNQDKSKLLIIKIGLFIFLLSGMFKPLFIDLMFMFFLGVLIAESVRIQDKYARLSYN